MRWLRRIVLAVLFVAVPIGVHLFVTRNSATVHIDYLGGRVEEVEVWLLLLASFIAGVVLASMVAMLRIARLRLEVRRYRKAAKSLESEVHQLRNLPLSAESGEIEGPDEELAALSETVRGP